MKKIKPTEEQLNEKFIIAHADCVEWRYLSTNIDLTQLSDKFFIRFHNEINWYYISDNKSMTTEFAHRHEKQIGYKLWYLNGEVHREDGPAVIYPDGIKLWFLNGNLMSKEEFKMEMANRNLSCEKTFKKEI